MDMREATFDGTYPFAPSISKAPGFKMHYVDEGQGAPILLTHGQPSWSYLYRLMIPLLASSHRVIAPDMKGFGKSETPADGAYDPVDQIDALEKFILDLDLTDITLVLHDWGGVIAGQVAMRHPQRFSHLVFMNTMMPLGLAIEPELLEQNGRESAYFQWMGKLFSEGTMEPVIGEFGTIVSAVMRDLQGIESDHTLQRTWVDAYSSPFKGRDQCVAAIELPKSIVSGSLSPEIDPEAAEALRQKPAMMVYGMQDRVLLPKYFIPIFEAQFPEAPVYRLKHAGHFLQEDAPETLCLMIEQFLRNTRA